MGQATFYLERIIKDGEEYVKVLGWKDVLAFSEISKFPEYEKEYPCFYSISCLNGEKLIIRYKNYFRGRVGILTRTLIKGTCFRKEDWKGLEKYMKQAGKRFSRILKERKWHGKFKVAI